MTARSDDVWAGAPSRPTSIRNLRALIDRTVICWGRGEQGMGPPLGFARTVGACMVPGSERSKDA